VREYLVREMRDVSACADEKKQWYIL